MKKLLNKSCGRLSGTPQHWCYVTPLQWRHNDHDGISNHQPHGCLLNRLIRRRSKKTSKLRITGLCRIHRWPVNSPHKGPGPCITNVFATRRKNFSQWHRSFQRKLLSHWLKFLRHVAITLVIQGPVTRKCFHFMTSSCHILGRVVFGVIPDKTISLDKNTFVLNIIFNLISIAQKTLMTVKLMINVIYDENVFKQTHIEVSVLVLITMYE